VTGHGPETLRSPDPAAGERWVKAVWSYETPYDAVAAIQDHLGLYPDQVELRKDRLP
jgi:uncharacterized protein (DUF427 family)